MRNQRIAIDDKRNETKRKLKYEISEVVKEEI